MAFVLVQHLDPTHDSQLPEILQRTTTMPVKQVTDGMAVERNTVYIIPPNTNLTVLGNVLHLTLRIVHTLNLPINTLFESLAEERGKNAIGVVLSGTGTDGTEGLKAIKKRNGITLVQTESSAKFDDMPRSAVNSGAADFVLSPADIAQHLSEIGGPFEDSAPEPEEQQAISPDEELELRRIFVLVHNASGVDFSHYKQTTARRRIARRMIVQRTESIGEYVAYLEAHAEEVQELYRDLLISVTQFFRDPEAFNALTNCLGPLLRSKESREAVRIWVPGCATGEEVYSLAICLQELFLQERRHRPLQIFGTDISESALGTARAGRYAESIEKEVSAERLQLYFQKTSGFYQINKSIRDLCIFARQDVTRDPPFSRVDLISCRNMLIYLDPLLQRRVLSTFHYSLNEGGLMFLGPAETTMECAELFEKVDLKHRIYMRLADAVSPKVSPAIPHGELTPTPLRFRPMATPADWRKQADQLVQDRYAPDGVIINQEMTIFQVRGRTGYYLRSAALGTTQNLLLLAHDGLQQPLRELALHAIAQNVPVRRKGLHLEYQGEAREVNLEVIPLSAGNAKERFFFVLLENANPQVASAEEVVTDTRMPETLEQEVIRLRQENAELNQLMYSLTVDHETAIEEQKATNEEISSANEELQSTNEELSTAKEELQSTNEELSTVNQELQNRNEEFSRVASDLTNILAAVNTPIIMLDRGLLVRRFTPAAELYFNLRPVDVGRGIRDISMWSHIADLQARVVQVMKTLAPITQEIQDEQGCWWSLSIRPFRTIDNRIDGAVLTFANIDSLKLSLEAAEVARLYAEGIVDTVRGPLLVLDAELRVKTANRAFYEDFRMAPAKTEGQFIYKLGDGEWNIAVLRTLLEEVLPQRTSFQDFEVIQEFPALGRRILLLNARQLRARADQLVLLAIEDVTEQKRLQDELMASNEDLERFAYAAAHDLRAPLNTSVRVAQILTEGLAGKLDEHESTMLTMFVENMERLRQLMENILTYSGMGHSPQHLEMLSLEDPVNLALIVLEPSIKSAGARIQIGTLPRLPLDRSRVAIVFQNLIDNALKYRREATPEIEIAAEAMGSYWRISVKDNGQGFDAQYVDRAFEPFRRLSDSSVAGSGIGLATCKRIVARMGGRIWAESVKGTGSTFYFTIPAEAVQAAVG
jgi:two-component system CheB/CheR fusion protein